MTVKEKKSMPTYPTSYYGPGLTTSYNNDYTRRLQTRDLVAFRQSQRFAGQWMEPKGVTLPYQGTLQSATGSLFMLLNELNLISPLIPDLGETVLLTSVGVATNILTGPNGVAVSYIGGVTTSTGPTNTATRIDGVGLSTNLRVLYYGLTTSSLNGVYSVTNVAGNFVLNRSADLTYWWQFAKPKVFLATAGTNNIARVFSLQSDAREIGNDFTVALGTSVATPALAAFSTTGTPIVMSITDFSPINNSGINASVLGTAGAGNTSLIYPAFNPNLNQNTGEYDFLQQASEQKFMYIKNRARRLAYQIFKMRENYTPFVSSYQSDVVTQIGAGNTQYNIGFSTLNNLPPQSRYPSSFNRGF